MLISSHNQQYHFFLQFIPELKLGRFLGEGPGRLEVEGPGRLEVDTVTLPLSLLEGPGKDSEDKKSIASRAFSTLDGDSESLLSILLPLYFLSY